VSQTEGVSRSGSELCHRLKVFQDLEVNCHRLKVFQDQVMTGLFRPKRGKWRDFGDNDVMRSLITCILHQLEICNQLEIRNSGRRAHGT
jgi:hypothetical protein